MIYTVTLNPAIDREYTVPEVTLDTVLRASQTRMDPGGKGFNVARMLNVLGESCVALGIVGGSSGKWLEQKLEAQGIETSFVWLDGETRTNTTVVPADHGEHLKVNEAGPVVSSIVQDLLLERVVGLVQEGDWWVVAGSLPPGVPAGYYRTLIELIRDKGGHVLLDTSRAPLEQGCLARPDWIKPNLPEVQALTGEEDVDKALNVLADRGVRNSLISLGKDGAMLVNEGKINMIRSPEIVEKNPVGAGDAMVGGFVWGLHRGDSPLDACRMGIACGAMAASQPGTDFGTSEGIMALLEKVGVE